MNINILYTANHKYLKQLLVSIFSLLENNKDININIYVVHSDFEQDDFKIIESVIKNFSKVNVNFYDFKIIKKYVDKYHIPCWRDTQIANARLFFSKIINNDNKLLYLDSDTIVVGSLESLKQYNNAIHMVEDSLPTTYWQNLEYRLDKYCNSGVILINKEEWENLECDKKIEEFLNKGFTVFFPDQDILNMALKDEINLLPPEYNLLAIDYTYISFLLAKYYKENNVFKDYTLEEINNAKKSPIILHSTPFYDHRPWDLKAIHPYTKIYNEYLKKINDGIQINDIYYLKYLLYQFYLNAKIVFPKDVRDGVKKIIKKC